MPISPDQQAEIDAQRAQSTPTLRAVSPGMEAHLYTAHEVLDHGFIRVIDYMGNDEAICQAYVGMLGRIGIKANLISQSRTLHFPAIQKRQVDFYLLGWGVPTFDSQYVFDFLVHSQAEGRGGWNGSRYNNPELDEKIRSLATETDLGKRNATIAEIWNTIQKDRVFLMVHNQLLAYASKDRVNIAVHPDWQQRGIATELMLELAWHARQRKCEALTLEVRHTNTAAQELYRRFGFVPAGVRRKYYENTDDAIVMWCTDIQSDEYSQRLTKIVQSRP